MRTLQIFVIDKGVRVLEYLSIFPNTFPIKNMHGLDECEPVSLDDELACLKHSQTRSNKSACDLAWENQQNLWRCLSLSPQPQHQHQPTPPSMTGDNGRNTLHSPTSPGGLLVHSWSIPESRWTPGSFLKFLRSPSPFLPHSCLIPASFLICVNMGMRKCATSKYGNLL